MDHFQRGLRLWDPIRDLSAFLELRRARRLSFPRWLASVARRQTFAYFQWADPMPAVARALKPIRRLLRRLTIKVRPTPALIEGGANP